MKDPLLDNGNAGASPAPGHDLVAVVVRPASASELRWICATWSRAMRASTYQDVGTKMVQFGRRGDGISIDASFLSRAHHLLVDSLIPNVTLHVACLPDVPTEPVGWCAFSGAVLHFVYVLPCVRRSGVARALLAGKHLLSASHMTPDGRHLEAYIGNEANQAE